MNDDNLINEALKEHARNPDGADQSFLDDLNAKLNHEVAPREEAEPARTSVHGIWLAAAAVVMTGVLVGVLVSSKPERDIPIVSFSGGEPETVTINERQYPKPTSAKVERMGSIPTTEVIPGEGGMSESELRNRIVGGQSPSNVRVPEVFGEGVALGDELVIEDVDFGAGFGDGDEWSGSGGAFNPSTFGRSVRGARLGNGLQDPHSSGNRYGQLIERGFQSPLKSPLSTFSIDVDTASYTNIRKRVELGARIDPNAVRIEEMVNYFSYDYQGPTGEHPFAVQTEVASCPWNSKHRLVKIALKGKEIQGDRKPVNLAFLIDVSGSMKSPDKLPLLVQSFAVLLKELNESDRVSLVVYAGREAVLLQPTAIDQDGRQQVKSALLSLSAGGSTNGSAGIATAYDLVRKGFIEGGVNRVILATDGDFNVGTTGDEGLLKLVKNQAEGQISLTILGFGQGNLNDDLMEQLTNHGDGNYFYIDSLREGQKVFQHDISGTLETIAKDVKIQVEFNPGKVARYRLVGYANRRLRDEDFRDDKIDAGDIGAGHRVTAFYEIVPLGLKELNGQIDLKYQKVRREKAKQEVVASPEMLTVKLRYKQPNGDLSTELSKALTDEGVAWQQASQDFQFASSVALWGLLLRDSDYAIEGSIDLLYELALKGSGDDPRGQRAGFIDLVRKWQTLR